MFSQFTYQWDDPTELEFDEPVRPYDILHLATSQRVPVYWQSDSVISRDSVYPANQWQPSFLVCKVREEGRNEFEVEGLRGNFLAKVSFEYLLKHNCITWASPLQPRTILQTCPFINESNGAWDSNMSQRYVTEYIRMPSDRDELSDFLEGSLAEDLVNSACSTVSKWQYLSDCLRDDTGLILASVRPPSLLGNVPNLPLHNFCWPIDTVKFSLMCWKCQLGGLLRPFEICNLPVRDDSSDNYPSLDELLKADWWDYEVVSSVVRLRWHVSHCLEGKTIEQDQAFPIDVDTPETNLIQSSDFLRDGDGVLPIHEKVGHGKYVSILQADAPKSNKHTFKSREHYATIEFLVQESIFIVYDGAVDFNSNLKTEWKGVLERYLLKFFVGSNSRFIFRSTPLNQNLPAWSRLRPAREGEYLILLSFQFNGIISNDQNLDMYGKYSLRPVYIQAEYPQTECGPIGAHAWDAVRQVVDDDNPIQNRLTYIDFDYQHFRLNGSRREDLARHSLASIDVLGNPNLKNLFKRKLVVRFDEIVREIERKRLIVQCLTDFFISLHKGPGRLVPKYVEECSPVPIMSNCTRAGTYPFLSSGSSRFILEQSAVHDNLDHTELPESLPPSPSLDDVSTNVSI